MPTRTEIRERARAMFARTPSVDDIVDRAYSLVLDAVGTRLRAVPV
jgi:stearoyl-CoA desaturase (delta-9 desaturase)